MALLNDDLSPDDFKVSRTHKIYCANGSPSEFRCKDYCPAVFGSILELQNIKYHEYIQAICGEELFWHVVSNARYGSTFILSADDRFVIKFLKKYDLKVMLEMLPSYYRHLKTYRASLLLKLFGLHVIEPIGGLKAYVAVVSNVMKADQHINRTFDLKGSTKGRSNLKMMVEDDAIDKDADFDYCFYLDPLVRHRLLKQIKYDCEFLVAEGIMDYSLLLGFVSCENSVREGSCAGTSQGHKAQLSLPFLSATSNSEKFGIKMPARAVRTQKDEVGVAYPVRSLAGEYRDVFLYFGIVDIFQPYNMVKRIEHVYKSLQYDSKSIAAINPKAYSGRFQEFLSRVFQSDDSDCLAMPSNKETRE